MRRLALLICIVLVQAGMGFTQNDDTQTIPLGGAFTITVPDNWEETQNSGNGYYWDTEDSMIRIRLYDLQDKTEFAIPDLDALLDVLAIGVFGAREIDEDAIESMEFGDYEGIAYEFEEISAGVRYMRQIQGYVADNDFIFGGYIRPKTGLELNEDDVNAMQEALGTIALQDTYIMHEGTQYDIVDGWDLTSDHNGNFVISNVNNGELDLEIALWPGYGAMAGFEDIGGLLNYYYTREAFYGFNPPYDSSKLEPVRVAGFDAISYVQNPDRVNDRGTYSRAIIELILPNNGVITVIVASNSPDADIEDMYDVLDTIVPGTKLVCGLFAEPGIRIRSEPTTNSELVRTTEQETLIAVSQLKDSAGYTWFDVTEGYVRSDVIFHEQKACQPIPTRNP